MKDSLTIIIPTHNRSKYLSRVLDYYSNLSCVILIADSSINRYDNSIEKNIFYYHFPSLLYVEKLNKIIQLVKTKYVLFCADDDFWVKEALLPCVEFLNDNDDYTSVQGKYIDFEYKKELTFIPSYLHAVSIEEQEIYQRLNACMENYMPLFYAMHRSEVLKRVFYDNSTTHLAHAILSELSVSFYSLIYGKHKNIELLTYVRDDESFPTPVKRDNLRDISQEEKFREEYNQFILNIATVIEEQCSRLDGKQVLRDSIALYVNKMNMNTPKYMKVKSLLKKYLFFLKPILQLYRNKKRIQKTFKNVENIKVYPHSSFEAKESWNEISNIIKTNDI